MKLLKAATKRRLSHGEDNVRIISRFEALYTNLGEIIKIRKNNPELRGTRDQMLEPVNILMLLLPTELLTHINRFSKFLQIRNLIYANVNEKLLQLKKAMQRTEENDGPLFKAHERK